MVHFGRRKKKSSDDNLKKASSGSADASSKIDTPKSMSAALAKMIVSKTKARSKSFYSPKEKEKSIPTSPVSPFRTNNISTDKVPRSEEDLFAITSGSGSEDEILHHSVTSLPQVSANMRALEARTFGAEDFEPVNKEEQKLADRMEKKRTPRGAMAVVEKAGLKEGVSLSEQWIINLDDLVLGKTIGHSSFGAVNEGKLNGTKVAVKTIQRDTRPGVPSNLDAIKKEAELNCKLRHPNIVLFMGICIQPAKVCIVTELMSRGNVRDLLVKVSKGNPIRLDWSLRQDWALDTARGMAYLHSHNPPMIHRDLKTTNLLVDRGMNVKICDFGLSRFCSDKLMSSVGTVHFGAPELLRNEKYCEKADLFSFGTVLWELYTRQPVFKGMAQIEVFNCVVEGNMPAVDNACDPRFKEIMTACWAMNPAERPSFREVIDKLLPLVEEKDDE